MSFGIERFNIPDNGFAARRFLERLIFEKDIYMIAKIFRTTLPDGQSQIIQYYLFQKAGEELPLHDHPYFHSTSCLSGQCEVYNSTGKRVVVEAGQLVELPAKKEHAIRALVDGTQIINLPEPGAR
jgi:quercetin dioxygenase-like cupin family protein